MDQGMESLVTGLSQGLSGYLGGQIQQKRQQENMEKQSQLSLQNAQTLKQQELDSEDVLSPDMAEKALPGFGAQMVQKYNSANPNRPLKLKDGVAYLDSAREALTPKTSKADTRHYLGNSPEGDAIFADNNGKMYAPDNSLYSGKVLPKSSTMPTSATRGSAEFATTILMLKDLLDLVRDAFTDNF